MSGNKAHTALNLPLVQHQLSFEQRFAAPLGLGKTIVHVHVNFAAHGVVTGHFIVPVPLGLGFHLVLVPPGLCMHLVLLVLGFHLVPMPAFFGTHVLLVLFGSGGSFMLVSLLGLHGNWAQPQAQGQPSPE